jgi:hypothetical protein
VTGEQAHNQHRRSIRLAPLRKRPTTEQFDARAIRACELVIAASFLQLGRSRRADLRSLSPASLFRISEAYAKASQKINTPYDGEWHNWGNLTADWALSLHSRFTIPFNFFREDILLKDDFN